MGHPKNVKSNDLSKGSVDKYDPLDGKYRCVVRKTEYITTLSTQEVEEFEFVLNSMKYKLFYDKRPIPKDVTNLSKAQLSKDIDYSFWGYSRLRKDLGRKDLPDDILLVLRRYRDSQARLSKDKRKRSKTLDAVPIYLRNALTRYAKQFIRDEMSFLILNTVNSSVRLGQSRTTLEAEYNAYNNVALKLGFSIRHVQRLYLEGRAKYMPNEDALPKKH